MAAVQSASGLLDEADLKPSTPAEDTQDHIGSNGSTPTGIATPQPDPADKRLPSIMHNYFQTDSTDETDLGSTPDRGAGSIFHTLKKYLVPPQQDPADPPSRRQTCLPVSSVSDDSVLATHFSLPSPPAPDTLPLPEASLLDHEQPHVATSEDFSKLTDHVPAGDCPKNTPPLTPRAMSNEDKASEKKSVTSAPQQPRESKPEENSTENPTESSTDEIVMKLDEAFPRQSSPHNGAPVDAIKGKLLVKISEARGLRPSFDPYVVCVFQWNEYISKGARDGEEEKKRRQIESDAEAAGRPMAIPMRSRQSSYNSALEGDSKGRCPVTDPHWDHEAVLYVSSFSVLRCLVANECEVMCWVITPKSILRSTTATTTKPSWATFASGSI
ncbi:hypothetical protein N7512_001324 [Penicillium capsulatum]|nr:hypothetical protein N7512_001324 [Penicillium capsulatum]